MVQKQNVHQTTATLGLAPDWVLIRDLPERIQDYFGKRPNDQWIRDFFEAIRLGVLRSDGIPLIRHRVREISFDPTTSAKRPSDRGQPIGGASGLQLSLHSEFDVSVSSWSDVDLRVPDFDVALPRQPDGSIPRYPVEVFWADVYAWERQRTTNEESAPPRPAQTAERPYDLALLKSCYMIRLAKWNDDIRNGGNFAAPSAADDLKWAQSKFKGVTRSVMRKVRKSVAPKSWQQTGPRTGEKWRN